jgi:hypothetical protein
MKYNERYSRTVPIQLGDLEQLHMALNVGRDYMAWLVDFRGVKEGAYNTVCATLSDAVLTSRRLLFNEDSTTTSSGMPEDKS